MKRDVGKTIGIIGCGNMGSALIFGMLRSHFRKPAELIAWDSDRGKLKMAIQTYKVRAARSNADLSFKSHVILLAVKPQQMKDVLQEVGPHLGHRPLLISIAAGISTKWIRQQIGDAAPVIRVMPNTPALVEKGISAIAEITVDGQTVPDMYLRVAEMILRSVGEVVRVPEKLMDAVTAISGSGPAYFFFLMERMVETGVYLGLPRKIATQLVLKTSEGAAHLARSGGDPKLLRERVTSRGGTTEAAFREFQRGHLDQILQRGIRAAARRAKELTP